jgi:DNA-binding transcriptional ArsR family regulator
MSEGEVLARAAALIGDPSRATMLWSLIGGESRPAGELAILANVSPQTASNHLKILVDADFLTVHARGRSRFYSLTGPRVAAVLEALAAVSNARRPIGGIAHKNAPELLFARTCYDHLAGELAVAIFIRLLQRNHLQQHADGFRITTEGKGFFRRLGIDVSCLEEKRRRLAYGCLDWSERTPHLGGALGAALLDWLSRERLVVRRKGTRAVRLGEAAHARLRETFGLELAQNRTALADLGDHATPLDALALSRGR